MTNKEKMKVYEQVVRRGIISFIVSTYFYSMFHLMFPKVSNVIVIPVCIGISILFFLELKKRVGDRYFNCFFDDNEVEEDVVFVVTFKLLGFGLLYFMFQLSIMITFFKAFAEVYIWNTPLYLPLFISNSFLMIQIYRSIYHEEFRRQEDYYV